jgi:hypothetical protein
LGVGLLANDEIYVRTTCTADGAAELGLKMDITTQSSGSGVEFLLSLSGVVQQQRRRWHTQKACLVEVQQSDSDDVKHKSAHAYMIIISKRKNRQN